MKIKKILFYFIAVALGGCIPVVSFHSLYTDKDVVFEEALLGLWADDQNEPDTFWEFTRIEEPNNAYKLVFADEEGKKGSFIAHLVKLKDQYFLDLCPSEFPIEDLNNVDWEFNAFFYLPCHTFIKVESMEPELILRITLETKMKELFEEHPDAIEYTYIDDRIVLTSQTKQLQEFILKYTEDERLFSDDIKLQRFKE